MDELTVDYLSEKPFFSLFFSKNVFSYAKIGDTIFGAKIGDTIFGRSPFPRSRRRPWHEKEVERA